MENEVNEPQNAENTPEPQENKAAGASKARKIASIVFDVILYAFLAFCVCMLIIVSVSKKKDGAVSLFGREMRIVVSASMEKSEYSYDASQYEIKDIPVRAAVFIKRAPDPEDEAAVKEWCKDLKTGDVLTFMYYVGNSQDVITHRIIALEETPSGYKISLRGDNRGSETATLNTQVLYTSLEDDPNNQFRFNYVIGKVTGVSKGLGYLVSGLQKPIVLALVIIVPCSIVMIWQIIRIVLVVGEDKKKKTAARLEEAEQKAQAEAEERQKQAQELEELRKQIEELKNGRGDGGE